MNIGDYLAGHVRLPDVLRLAPGASEMSKQTNHTQILALCAILLTAVSGIVAGQFLPLSYAMPVLALLMLLWTIVGRLLSGWRAVMTGLFALLSAFAGLIGAYLPALLLALLASVTLMRFDATRSSEIS